LRWEALRVSLASKALAAVTNAGRDSFETLAPVKGISTKDTGIGFGKWGVVRGTADFPAKGLPSESFTRRTRGEERAPEGAARKD